MKIALLWPDYWPYVRRGTERMTHDIAHYLARRGHEVHILTTKPGKARVRDEDGVRVISASQVGHPLLVRSRWVPRFDTHPLQVLPVLVRERYDLIHAFFYTYGPILRLVRRMIGTPYVFHVVTIPPAWERRGDERLLRFTLQGAAAVRVFSNWCADYLKEHYRQSSVVLAPTVDQNHFRPVAKRDSDYPRILFTGDLAEERKNAHLLAQAFNTVHKRHPRTRLVFAGPMGLFGSAAHVFNRLDVSTRDAVINHGTGRLTALPALYASATVTTLPARGEPFGMVMTESLSCGTPVVGARSGALPEIIDDPRIGRLFDLAEGDDPQSAQNLAAALEGGLELAADKGVADLCRERAREWTWEVQGPKLEAVQEKARASRGGR